MANPAEGKHPILAQAIQAAADMDAAIAQTANAAATSAGNAATAAANSATSAGQAATAANNAVTAAGQAVTAAQAIAAPDLGLRYFAGVKTTPAGPLVPTGSSAALPNVRPTSTFVLASLVAETVTAPTALNVTVKVGYTTNNTFTALITKAVALASFAAVNNVVSLLGITATASALPRWPAGATPQISATDGTFNFIGQFVEVPVNS